MGVETITKWLDYIPSFIEGVRTFITGILGALNLPIDPTYSLIIGIVALVGTYYWFKQWVATSLFLKMSTLLNWLLLALLIYVVMVYV